MRQKDSKKTQKNGLKFKKLRNICFCIGPCWRSCPYILKGGPGRKRVGTTVLAWWGVGQLIVYCRSGGLLSHLHAIKEIVLFNVINVPSLLCISDKLDSRIKYD